MPRISAVATLLILAALGACSRPSGSTTDANNPNSPIDTDGGAPDGVAR
jgi:hypothetical protein